LPQDERTAFVKNFPDSWSRIHSEMSKSMRQSRDLNLYIGDKAGTDRASVLAQLADAKTWQEANAPLLDGLVRMAIAMTEHRFAFERSKEFKAVEKPKLKPLVEKYRLWDKAAGRNEYSAKILQGTRWHEEGIFADLKSLWAGLVTLWKTDVLFVGSSIGVRLDLNDVQDFMGGDLKGAQLGDPHKGKARKNTTHPDANKVMLLVGLNGKSAEVILPELLIDSANVQLAGTTLQTGKVTLKKLHIFAAYDSDGLSQPTEAKVQMDSVEANDLLLAKSASMLTLNRLVVKALRLAAGTVDTLVSGSAPRKGRYVPFPLLVVPLLALFMLLALPVYIYRKISALFAQGLESNTGEQFAGDVAERTKAIAFSFDSLNVEGLTTSGGQHVSNIGVRDFALRLGLNKPTRLRAEKASIEQRLRALGNKPEAAQAVSKLNARLLQVKAELATLEQAEKEYVRIKERIAKGDLTPQQQQQLQQRLDALNLEDKGGAYIDIGSIQASGISGTVTSKEPISLANIHGEGGSAALTQMLGLPTVTDSELSRRSAAGERPGASFAEGQAGNFHLELGNIHTGEISFGGGVYTVASIDEKIKVLEKYKTQEHYRALYDSLLILRAKALRYELMVRHGVSNLTAPQLAEFRQLRADLTGPADLIIKSIDITQATMDVNLANGRVAIGLERARIAGIELPQKGIQVDEIIAKGLGVGALPSGGLMGWADWQKNLQQAHGKVDFLQVSGVRSQYHGLLLQKATLTGPYATLKERGNVLEAGLKNLTLEGVGLVPRIGILNQKLAGLKEKARVATGEEKSKLETEITALSSKITELQGLADKRVAAYMQLQAAKTPEEIAKAKEAVAYTDTTIILGLSQYGASRGDLNDFGIKVTGAGDLVGDLTDAGINVARILDRGVRIQGAGPNNRVFSSFSLEGINAKSDQSDKGLLASGNINIGGTNTDVSLQRQGDSVFVELRTFKIASLAMDNMELTSDESGIGMQIASDGRSSLEGLSVSGKLRLDKRAGSKGEFPGDYRLANIYISDFVIKKLTANGLTYASIPDKIEVSIKSGSIEGIWASQLNIDVPADKNDSVKISGAAGIHTITDVEIGAALSSGLKLQRGKINGSRLRVDFLLQGAIKATVGDLSATAMHIRGPDGWARFNLNHLSGSVTYKDGEFTIHEVKLGSFEVPGIDWRFGQRSIKADKMAKIVDLRASGKVVTRQVPSKTVPAKKGATNKDGSPAETKTELSEVKISSFRIGSVIAEHLIYRDGDNKIEIGASKKELSEDMKAFRPLFIQEIVVKNLEWKKGKGLVGKLTEIDVRSFEVSAVFENLKKDMKAGFALKGTGLGATFVGSNFKVGSTGCGLQL
ncbi:MAG: hypothetical protein P8Y45_15595, partial [Exilibacterium sp.]